MNTIRHTAGWWGWTWWVRIWRPCARLHAQLHASRSAVPVWAL